MPRHFTAASTESITFSAGGLASLDGGPITVACIWLPDTTSTHGLVVGLNGGGSQVWGYNPYSDGHYYYTAQTFVASPAACDYVAAEWQLTAVTKADTAVIPRWHRYLYNSSAWAHADAAASTGDSTGGPITAAKLGTLTGSDLLNGDLALAAVWGRVLSDGEVESLAFNLANWAASTPTALWVLNQTSTATPVTDLSGGGADQTAISGTTVSSTDVPGFSYGVVPQRELMQRYGMLMDWRLVYG